MTVMNQEVTQKQSQTFYISWTSKSERQGFVVVQKIIGVQAEHRHRRQQDQLRFHQRRSSEAKQSMTDFFNALKTLELTFTIDPKTLAIKKVEGGEKLIEKLSESTPPMKALLKNILSDEAIKQMAQPTWGAIPTSPKKVGETWNSRTSSSTWAPLAATHQVYLQARSSRRQEERLRQDYRHAQAHLQGSHRQERARAAFEILSNSTLTSVEDAARARSSSTERRAASTARISHEAEGNLVIKVARWKPQ